MPPTFEHLSVNLLFIVIGVISPFPALAIPLSPQDPPTLFEPVITESSHKIIFGIVFVFSKASVRCSPEHVCSLRSVSSAFHHYRDRICMRGIPNAALQVHCVCRSCVFSSLERKLVSLPQDPNYTEICVTSASMMQIISSLRLHKFFEKAADAIVDANDVHALSTRTQSGGMGNLSTITRSSSV